MIVVSLLNNPISLKNFKQLGLSSQLEEVLNAHNIVQPTPIQEKAIPLLLSDKPTDFVGLAQTGTGKTAAFGLPLIQLIDERSTTTQALILSPTRELAQQTSGQISLFAKAKKGVHVVTVYGGAPISVQIKALRKPTQIVVATPGRLIDLIGRKAVDLAHVKYIVLDEADEMLSMGFQESIDEILESTGKNKVTWLFSATMPREIKRIASQYMHKPKEIRINPEERSNKDISHQYVVTKTDQKLAAIQRFLEMEPDMKAVLFCRTRRDTQKIADDLNKLGYGAEALHGEMSQSQRDAVMKKFKTRSLQMLVATDVAARGIDVNELTHVMHHTLPDQLEYYTHRSGRTGRAGNKGTSLAFINGRERGKVRKLEKDLQISFKETDVPTMASLKANRIQHWANFIINTKVDEGSEEILNEVRAHFAGLSKDEILKRLITTQLDHLLAQEDVDFAEEPKKSSKTDQYYVNIGSVDGLTKGDIIHFLREYGELQADEVGNINLFKTYFYVQLPKGLGSGFTRKFEGLEMDGRAIRVKLDEKSEPKRERKNVGRRHRKKRR